MIEDLQQITTIVVLYAWLPIVGVYVKCVNFFKEKLTGVVMPAYAKIKYVPVEKKLSKGLVIITYKSVVVDLEDELRRMGYSITVKEVSDIKEAFEIVFKYLNNLFKYLGILGTHMPLILVLK